MGDFIEAVCALLVVGAVTLIEIEILIFIGRIAVATASILAWPFRAAWRRWA